MAVLVFSVVMAEAGVKEPPIASRAAIRILRQHMVKEPIFEAASSRPVEFFATAMGTTRGLRLKGGFVHGEPSAGDGYVTTSSGRTGSVVREPLRGSLSSELHWNLVVSPGKRIIKGRPFGVGFDRSHQHLQGAPS